MFKCGEKCTGILAAEARLTREKVCFASAKKEKDECGMKRAQKKINDTTEYIKIMEEWPPAVNLAILPALRVARLKPPARKQVIMKQVEQVMETGVNPINGLPLSLFGVTGIIIEYLIAKHDGKPFVREKRFMLTRENLNSIKYLLAICKDNPKAANFLKALAATA